MRQLRFILITFFTSLFVINATVLRKAVAILLCGVLSFNSASGYGFLNQGEMADAAPPRSRTVKPSQSPRSSPATTPQYQFQLVGKSGLVVDGKKIEYINHTIPWKKHRLIDEAGHVVFQDSNTGTIFYADKAVAFINKRIGNYFVKAIEDYFFFKDGTLDILLSVAEVNNPSGLYNYILVRKDNILIEDNHSGVLETVPGYPDEYYVQSNSHNNHPLKNGVTEVAETPKSRKPVTPPNLADANPSKCVSNDKNQNVCSSFNFGYLVRDGKQYLPGIGTPLAINNNGRVITSFLQVLDYEKNALPSVKLALEKSGSVQIEGIRSRHRSDLSASNLASPIYDNAVIPHRIKIAAKSFGISNHLNYGIHYLQLTDSGYMALVFIDPANGYGMILRAKPAGSTTTEPNQCPDTTIKPTDDAKAIVRKFREKFAPNPANPNCTSKSPWKGINEPSDAKPIADRLDELIVDSSLIEQGQLNICGPAAFFYLWFKNDPRAATLYATELYEKGKSKIGNIDVDPKHLLTSGNYDKGKDGTEAADWMMLGALRDSENKNPLTPSFLGIPGEALGGFTLPLEIKKWLEATNLYKDVYLYTIPKKVPKYPNSVEKDRETDWNKLMQDFSNPDDKDIILLVDATRLPGEPPNTFPFPNHYIVLTSSMSLEQNTNKVKLSYWSWGRTYDSKTFDKFFIETISGIMAKK